MLVPASTTFSHMGRISKLTSVLVRDDLGLVINSVCDGAVRVAKGDTDRHTLTWLRARLSSFLFTHLD